MGIQRSIHNTNKTAINQIPATPFLVESFSWAMTKPFESWYAQRKRYAAYRTCAEIIQHVMGQCNRSTIPTINSNKTL